MAQYEVETSEETGTIQNNNHGKKTRWQHDYVDMSNFVIENLVGVYTLIMLFASELYYNMFAIPCAEMYLI